MKKLLSIICAFSVFFFLGTSLVSAQEETSVSVETTTSTEIKTEEVRPAPFRININRDEKNDDMREISEQKRLDLRANITEKQEALREKVEINRAELEKRSEERRTALTEKLEKRGESIGERIISRLSIVIANLETNAKRIGSRIAKIEERGIDLSEAKRLLDQAYENINEMKEKMASLGELDIEVDVEAEVSTSSEEVEAPGQILREAVSSFRILAKEVLELARETKSLLVQSLNSIKSSLPEVEENEDEDSEEEGEEESEDEE